MDKELLKNTYWQSNMLLYIKRANKYFPVIESILAKNKIPDDFKYLLARDSIPELIIIGVGDILDNPYYELREYFSNQKIPFDIMTTRSACRTWNFLIAERNNICVHLILD